MMPRLSGTAGTRKIKPGVLAIRGAGPFRSSIRRASFDAPGLVIEVEKLDTDTLSYASFLEIQPEDLSAFVESLSLLKDAAEEAAVRLKEQSR